MATPTNDYNGTDDMTPQRRPSTADGTVTGNNANINPAIASINSQLSNLTHYSFSPELYTFTRPSPTAFNVSEDAYFLRGTHISTNTPVIAKVSQHVLRLEREYHVFQHLGGIEEAFSGGKEEQIGRGEGKARKLVVDVLDLVHAHSRAEMNLGQARGPGPGPGSCAAIIYTDPGLNALADWTSTEMITVPPFLDFAIAACEVLEFIHGQDLVHGELRPESFHWNVEEGVVRLMNFGSGLKSFQNGLTSSGWSSLAREKGVEGRLMFISPEQTGRTSNEPDHRTDIYSLGILFYMLLTRQYPFEGSPMEILQAALSRRTPAVHTVRPDVPEVITHIIQKMTAKMTDERYHSAGGLKADLLECQRQLRSGEAGTGIEAFLLGQKDVTSFFCLPAKIFGRDQERETMLGIVRRVARRHQVASAQRMGIIDVHTQPSLSEAHLEQFSNSSAASDSAYMPYSTSGMSISGSSAGGVQGRSDGSKSYCEVIALSGPTGVGKSALVNVIQSEARKYGYFASAQFDRAQQTPYGAILRGISSIMRQVLTESEAAIGEFYQELKAFLGPQFGNIYFMVDLVPELRPVLNFDAESGGGSQTGPGLTGKDSNSNLAASVEANTSAAPAAHAPSNSSNSSISSAGGGGTGAVAGSASQATDVLRSGGAKLRFVAMFLDVLRMLAQSKMITLVLDDLHAADDASLDLLANIVNSRIRMLLLVSYRDTEMLPEKLESILGSENGRVTHIPLAPLGTQAITEYVACALHREEEFVGPLAQVIEQKTKGSPFYTRELLLSLHRKGEISFDWRVGQWTYDINSVKQELDVIQRDEVDVSFLVSRLRELSPDGQAFVQWAAFVGTSFSFAMVKSLLGHRVEDFGGNSSDENVSRPKSLRDIQVNAVNGLQAALQAAIIVPGDADDDNFRFSHDGYVRAAFELSDPSDREKMHFIIAQIMLCDEDYDVYFVGDHLGKALNLVKTMADTRHARDVFYRAAAKAATSGAHEVSLGYYLKSMELLPEKPWDEPPGITYEEVLELYLLTAECHWWCRNLVEAQELVDEIFKKAKSIQDKAPAYRLLSRLLYEKRQYSDSMDKIMDCLTQLDDSITREPTMELLNDMFMKLKPRVESMDFEEALEAPMITNERMITISSLLAEALASAYFCSPLLFLYSALMIMQLNLDHGMFEGVGIAYLAFGTVASAQYGLPRFGADVGRYGYELVVRYGDQATKARGILSYHVLMSHFHEHVRVVAPGASTAFKFAINTGDRVYATFSLAHLAVGKWAVSANLVETAAFCDYALSEIGTWGKDTDGATLVHGIGQSVRALQGLTLVDQPDGVLTDADGPFNYAEHMDWVRKTSANFEVADVWISMFQICPLFLYGHYDKAIEVGKSCTGRIALHPCLRQVRFMQFVYSLAIIAKIRRDDVTGADREEFLEQVKANQNSIATYMAIYSDNYFMWYKLVEAELLCLEGNFAQATVAFEAAGEACAEQGFRLEEAMTCQLAGEFYLRNGLKRVARGLLRDALSMYLILGATGVGEHFSQKHSVTLRSPTQGLVVDVGVQTDSVMPNFQEGRSGSIIGMNNDFQFDGPVVTQPWVNKSGIEIENAEPPTSTDDPNYLTLDIIDLTSIISSSQVLASEMNVETLFQKLLQIVIENTGGSLSAIVVKDDGIFAIAAVGHAETGKYVTYKPPRTLVDEEQDLSTRIVNYVIHTKEALFLENSLEDERFCAGAWFQQNPNGKSVIGLPIMYKATLVGVLYLEGAIHSLTSRHVSVLSLLSSQIGISITNALLFKSVQKATLANISMIESQKQALQAAKESEAKYVAVLETMPCVIYSADPVNGKLDYLNAYWWAFAGADAASWEDGAWLNHVHSEDKSVLEESMAAAIRTGAYPEVEVRLRRADGEYRWHLCRKMPLKNHSGKIVKWIGAFIDIDDQKTAVLSKTAFLANMSHELRTPFSGFYGMLNLLVETELDAEQRDIVTTAKQSCEMLLQIIDDLLNFSKLEAGKVQLEPDLIFTTEDVLADCVELVQPLAVKKGLELAFDIDPKVPTRLAGDATKIRQVLTNLLGNAVKFTKDGYVQVQCSLQAPPSYVTDPDACFIRFEVQDTGIGMSQNDMKTLFKPFSQVDGSTTRRYGGTGLGLSICLQICKLMEGDIGVTAEVDKGSTFWFYVRVRSIPANHASANSDEEIRMLSEIRQQLAGKEILLASQHKFVDRTLAPVLSSAKVHRAYSFQQAESIMTLAVDRGDPLRIVVWACDKDIAPDFIRSVLENKKLVASQIIWYYTPKTNTGVGPICGDPQSVASMVVKYGSRLTRMAAPVRRAKLVMSFSKALANLKDGGENGVPTSSPIPAKASTSRPGVSNLFTQSELESFQGKKILIAEDNPVAQKLLTKQLTKFGLEVEAANNGLEAVAHFEQHPPGYFAMFFADHHMPLCDGVEATRRIRKIERENEYEMIIPIIALTADIQQSAKESCLEAGMTKYLTKPLLQASLVSTLRQFLLQE
ncbi:hypothetical protein G7K_6598-t1 [Saitoella complicata NRRL Y-17804]|uniref:histidine kinase n=1 Tax=Saitoella complicata (strain BCRC 22490 / CBS 7301 / JCM 7358 / NBRC 10748 / NRRL Y-17804) TaxID=698492 RepID=A0A0E9NRN6_SAICN|nr:hypothetical protein G7K_6598-t1 [Saitoella complicata NRRL Y-17804]